MNAPISKLALRAIEKNWKAKLPITLSAWANKNRKLSGESSPIEGAWSTDETPYLREIMDALSEHSTCHKVVLKKGSQLGGTEVGSNWLGYIMCHAKGPAAVVMPTEKSMDDWMVQKFDPMVKASPVISEVLSKRTNHSAENSGQRKKFVGGALFMKTAGSVAELKSTSLRYVLGDEIDEWEDDKQQGNKIDLLEVRLRAFRKSGAKIYLVSSPTIKDASNIDAQYKGGDQRKYMVPCPHCNERQDLIFENLKWTKHPDTHKVLSVHYVCKHCGCTIDESHKRWMMHPDRAVWIPQNPEAEYRSYHISSLYSSERLGLSWLNIAQMWIDAQGDDARLKVFKNTILGECWELKGEIKANILKERIEPYDLRTVPTGCLGITCGVDTQDNRLEITVLGHGMAGRTWTLDYHVIYGSPAGDELWQNLTQYINGIQFVNQFGKVLKSEATAIDTGGHFTHDVYEYVRGRHIVRPMACKGASTKGRVILGKPTDQDINRKGKTIKKGVKLYQIGTDTAKHLLYNRLHDDADKPVEKRKVHFSHQLDDAYYDGLVAEVYDPTRNEWKCKKGKRNEPLDTWVLAVAASHHPELYWHKYKVADWERKAAMYEPQQIDTSTNEAAQQPPTTSPPVEVVSAGGKISLPGKAGRFAG